jgi:glycogen phosphorylase
MKFAMNGALTIGTLDGANIEIREAVGEENIYIFGLKADAIEDLRRCGTYHPEELYHRHADLRRVLDSFHSAFFRPEEPGLSQWIYDTLAQAGDPYFHLADFHSYVEAHRRLQEEFCTPALWARKAILNVARVGRFSSDRTIAEYAAQIWHIEPVC